MRNHEIDLRFVIFLVAIAIVNGACNKEESCSPVNGSCDKEELLPPCFGMEEGYFWWIDKDEKIWLKRDRNHLSIRFYEDYGKVFHDSILEEYGIQTVWSQTFDKHPPMPGYYRVTKNPAEEYYTSYGDTTLNRIGNLPEVEYALPVFYKNEDFRDLMLTPVILYTFKDSITNDRQEEILDSLMTVDNLMQHQLFQGEEWSPYNIYVTKSSPADPYALYHRYYETGFFKSLSLNYAFTTRWLEN